MQEKNGRGSLRFSGLKSIKSRKNGEVMTFYIRKDSKSGGYVIVRVGGDYDMHAHIKSMNGCHQLIRLIEQGLEPKSEWLQQAARRILYESEYERLKRCKDKYVNRR